MYPAKTSANYLEEAGYNRLYDNKWNFSLAINERSSLHLTGGLWLGPDRRSLYLTGNLGFEPENFITNDTWWLDISNGESIWKEGPKMKKPRHLHSSCILGSNLFVFGGLLEDL